MEERIFNPLTGEITIKQVSDVPISVDGLRLDMINSMISLYGEVLERGPLSSANGSLIQYGYDQNYQIIYNKWANVLALDPTRSSVTFSTPDGTIVTLTRSQFIQFMNDAEQFELNLFNNRNNLETQLKSASTVDELKAIKIIL